jgi:hypothetical protein
MKITLLYTTARQTQPALVLWPLDAYWYLVVGAVPAAIKASARTYRLHNGSNAYCIPPDVVHALKRNAVRVVERGEERAE